MVSICGVHGMLPGGIWICLSFNPRADKSRATSGGLWVLGHVVSVGNGPRGQDE